MTIPAQDVEKLILDFYPSAEISVIDLTGTQDHYKVVVVASDFSGKNSVQRHQMIYEALKEPLKGPLHALTIEAYTQDEWQSKIDNAPTSEPQGIKL